MNPKNIFLTAIILTSFFSVVVLANAAELPNPGATPDSSLYFLKTWKESIQTFFTFGLENKAKQYLHLADVRLAEYQKMIDKGKTDIAQKTLDKYERQLNKAFQVMIKKTKAKDILPSLKDEPITEKHIGVLEENLQKVPEAGKKGIEKALETLRRLKGARKDETANWKTYRNEEFGFEVKYPTNWKFRENYWRTDNSVPAAFTFESPEKDSVYGGPAAQFVIMKYLKNDYEVLPLSSQTPNVENSSLEGLPVLRLVEINEKTGCGTGMEICPYFAVKNIRIYQESKRIELNLIIGGYDQQKNQVYSPIFDQILSTFKFIK